MGCGGRLYCPRILLDSQEVLEGIQQYQHWQPSHAVEERIPTVEQHPNPSQCQSLRARCKLPQQHFSSQPPSASSPPLSPSPYPPQTKTQNRKRPTRTARQRSTNGARHSHSRKSCSEFSRNWQTPLQCRGGVSSTLRSWY